MNQFIAKIFATLIVVYLSGCGQNYSDAEHVARAKINLQKDEPNAAAVELKSALSKNINNLEARLLLGQIDYEAGRYVSAEFELQKAVTSEAFVGQAIPLLARVYVQLGKFSELDSLSLAGLTAQSQADLLTSKAMGNITRHSLPRAERQIREALSKDPGSNYALIARARLAAINEDYDTAREGIETVLTTDPHSGPAYTVLGDIEQSLGNFQQAESAYVNAIQYKANDFSERLKLVNMQIALGKLDEALSQVEQLIKVAPRSYEAAYAFGLVKYHQQEYQQAIDALSSLPPASFTLAPFYLASSYLQLDDIPKAELSADLFHTLKPEHTSGNHMLASIKLQMGKSTEAEAILRPMLQRGNNDPATLELLANALLQQGITDETITLLQTIVEQQKDSAEANMLLGNALLIAGRSEDGIAYLNAAINLEPGYARAYILLASHYQRTNNTDQAIAVAQQYHQAAPNSVIPHNLIGRIYLADGNTQQAANAFQRALEIEPVNLEAMYEVLAMAIDQGKLGLARDLAEQLLQQHEDHLPTMLQLAYIQIMQSDKQGAVKTLEATLTAYPAAVEPRLKLAQLYLEDGASAKAVAILERFSRLPDSAAPLEALELLAVAQLLEKDYEATKYTLQKRNQMPPEKASNYFLLARAYSALQQYKKMQQSLERAIELDPEHFEANLALAKLYALGNEADKLKEKLQRLKAIQPRHTEVLLVESSWENAQGNPGSALTILKQLHSKSRSTSSLLALSAQMKAMGDIDGAERLLQEWTSEHGQDLDARIALASLYTTEQQLELANTQYVKVLEQDESNIAALNNLAWNLQKTSSSKALRLVKRAHALAPKTRHIIVTYAMILMENGRQQDALNMIDRAVELQPEHTTTLYYKALIESTAGHEGKAVTSLQKALSNDNDFAEREAASSLLSTLIKNAQNSQ